MVAKMTEYHSIPLKISASDNNKKRNKIKKYFNTTLYIIIPIILIIVGFSSFFIKVEGNFNIKFLGLILIIIGSIVAILLIKNPAPSDQEIDIFLSDDIKELQNRALERLNIDSSELIRDSIVIRGPIFWKPNGVSKEEVLWKTGKDKITRFNINAITIITLTEHKLSAYQCDYNFMRGVPLNERDIEFFYIDVVAVSTRDAATAEQHTLPNGTSIKQAQFFKLSVPNESIEVLVDSGDLRRYTGGTMPDTGLDNAIKALRKVLSEKKI